MNDPFESVAELLCVDYPAPEETAHSASDMATAQVSKAKLHNRAPNGGNGLTPLPRAEYRSSSEQDGKDRLDCLPFNEREGQPKGYVCLREKWEHRCVALLKAQGLSNKEIAERTGYNAISVGKILRQPWVQDTIREEIKRAGRDAVQELLHASTYDSVVTLIEIRDDENAKGSERINAANSLLNRTYGMPNQPISHDTQVNLEELTDEELAKIVTKGRSN